MFLLLGGGRDVKRGITVLKLYKSVFLPLYLRGLGIRKIIRRHQ